MLHARDGIGVSIGKRGALSKSESETSWRGVRHGMFVESAWQRYISL
jgi:hypothetical protein